MTTPEPLPGLLAEFAAIVGREAALRIAECKGGCKVTIPSADHLRDNHWLVALIGAEQARVLCREFSATSRVQADIPLGPFGALEIAKRQRDEIIEAAIAEGLPASAIARRAGITRNSVQRRLRHLRLARQTSEKGHLK